MKNWRNICSFEMSKYAWKKMVFVNQSQRKGGPSPECPSIPSPPGEYFRTAYYPDVFCVVRKQIRDLGGHYKIMSYLSNLNSFF